MIHIAIAGGDGPGGSAEGRIPNPFFKKNALIRARVWRLASDRPYIVGVSGAKITVRRAVFSSDLTFMSNNEPWLLAFMALGANLKISIFDPPSVGGTYILILQYRSCKMRCFCDKKAAQVGKSALFPYYIWTILSTKFCTASLDHMRRGFKVVLRKKTTKKCPYKPEK